MKPVFTILVATLIWGLCLPLAEARESQYRPLGMTSRASLSSAVDGFHPIKPADRVVLPGLRPVAAELLQQTLQQRYARSLGKSPELVSQRAVPKIFSDGPSFARARGIYAELRYVNQNSEAGLVGKRNATQNDLYMRPLHQRTPVGIQVKTLSSGPRGYASAMVQDHRARWFVVPDDHVAGIKQHWQQLAEEHAAAGRQQETRNAYRQRARVKGMGITMAELENEMRAGGRHLVREQTARYVSYGAAALIALAPVAQDLMQEGHLTESGFQRAAHGLALTTTALGTDQLLKRYKAGALRGTLRGNVLTGGVILLADSGFALWEYGGTAAFSRPGFYERVGGSIGGVALGLSVGVPVGTQVAIWTSPTGGWAIVFGGAAGVISGSAAGLAGKFFGQAGTRFVIRSLAPSMLLEQDLKPIDAANEEMRGKIADLRRWDFTN